MKGPTLPERIEKIVREWPQWSRAERAKMPELVEEIMDHCRNGTGNGFIRSWCQRVLAPKLPGLMLAEFDSISVPFQGPK